MNKKSQLILFKKIHNQVEARLDFAHSPLPNPLHPLQGKYYLVCFNYLQI